MGARRAVAALAVAAAGLLTPLAPPAAAHPFGPPPTALIAARGNAVLIDWSGAADDAIAIGERLGFFPAGTAAAYREGPAQVAPSRADEEALGRSDELRNYLLEHISVRQDGTACDGTVSPITDFVVNGARVVHTCPRPVTVADLEITMLHDLHEAYRTFGISRDPTAEPQQAVFSVSSPRHTWDFTGATAQPARSTPWLPAVLLGAGVLLGAAVLVVLRRRRHGS